MRALPVLVLALSPLAVSCSAPTNDAQVASIVDGHHNYYVDLHFSANAYGKAVKSVLAHTGVELRYPEFTRRPSRWESVKDVSLAKAGESFFGRVHLKATSTSGSFTISATPVVQYFIEFTDGTSRITDVAALPQGDSIVIDYDSGIVSLRTKAAELVSSAPVPTSSRVVLQTTSWNDDRTSAEQVARETGLDRLFP